MALITPFSNPTQASPGITVRMMSAQTVDETLSTVICPSPGCKNHTFSLRSSASITGAVQLETSNDLSFAGAWAPLGGGPINVADIGPAAAGILEFTFSNIAIVAVRARISTVIAGGNLTVDYTGGR